MSDGGDINHCYMIIFERVDNENINIACPNKPYGKLKGEGNNWYYYCKSCFKYQLKKQPKVWIAKEIFKLNGKKR